MSASLSVLENVLVGKVGAAKITSKARTPQVAGQLYPLAANQPCSSNHLKKIASDNIDNISPDTLVKIGRCDFNFFFRKSIKSPSKIEKHIEMSYIKEKKQTSDKTQTKIFTPNLPNTVIPNLDAIQEASTDKLLLKESLPEEMYQMCLKKAEGKITDKSEQLIIRHGANLNNIFKFVTGDTQKETKNFNKTVAASDRFIFTKNIENNTGVKKLSEKSSSDAVKAKPTSQKFKSKESLITFPIKKDSATVNLSKVQEKLYVSKQLGQPDLVKSSSIIESPKKGKYINSRTFNETLKNDEKNQTNTSTQGSSDKSHVSNIQISTVTTRNRNDFMFNHKSNTEIEQIISTNNAQVHVAVQSSQSSTTTQTATVAINTPGGIGQQILESMYVSLGREERQITIQLNPPELGRVFIKFEQQQDEITCLLQVSKQETRCEIEQVLPGVMRFLQDSGIQIRRVDVMLADQQEQQTDKEQFLQDSSSQQQDFEQRGDSDNKSMNNLTPNDARYHVSSEQQVQVSQTGINMLI